MGQDFTTGGGGRAPDSYARQLPDGRWECLICPRGCRLRAGQRGFCFVRAADEHGLRLTTYGRSSGFCIDPIEKKPLYHFLPGTPVLSFGTAGCNLSCSFCQNWDISHAREFERLSAVAAPERIAEAAAGHGCRSVAFTYNDPAIFSEYAIATALACRARQIATVAVTAGAIQGQARQDLFSVMDAANVDLKAFSDGFYRKLCGIPLASVLDTLRYLAHDTTVHLEITTLLIPGLNDSDHELRQLCSFVRDELGPEVPQHFSAFHPSGRMRNTEATPPATLHRARDIAREMGLHYVYVGNIQDPDATTTWCPACGTAVIERDWYEICSWRLHAGRCRHCHSPIAGRFEEHPGDWGRKRLPISIEG
ncbi:MAG: AmmeMemoRadiSam system radical SAM enzyme [Planctomycetota bacterium]